MSPPNTGAGRGPKGFTGYAEDLEPEVLEFQRRAYPTRLPERILPNWRWMFVEPARRLGTAPPVWMYRKDHRVVAHQGAIPVRFKLGDTSRITGWFVETMADEAVRGSAIGPMLIRKALEDLPFNLSLGQTDQMRELQFALGWKYVRDLATYLFVTGPGMDLSHRLPPLVAGAAAAGLALAQQAQLARRRFGVPRRCRVRDIERCDAGHDALWAAMADEIDCTVIRDAAYLNWKYVDRPGADFRLVELRDGDTLAGLAVLRLRDPGDAYRYRRGFIVDLVVRPSRADHVRALLVEAITALGRAGAATVTFYVGQPALEHQLRAFGFLPREPRYQLLVATGGLDEAETARVLDPDAWYLTLGDSDADAYGG